jgi:hypothetical protein
MKGEHDATRRRLPALGRAVRLRDVIRKLDASEQALFFFLAACAGGRPRFTATIDALLPRLTHCSRERFIALTQRLAACGLLGLNALGESGLIIWTLPEVAAMEPVVLREDAGKRFYIPAAAKDDLRSRDSRKTAAP